MLETDELNRHSIKARASISRWLAIVGLVAGGLPAAFIAMGICLAGHVPETWLAALGLPLRAAPFAAILAGLVSLVAKRNWTAGAAMATGVFWILSAWLWTTYVPDR
jgi:hypothetical protein